MSTTSNRLRKQAKKVTEDLQEMGGTVRDAAQEKLGQVGETVSEYYEQGRDKVHDAKRSVRAIHPRTAAEVRLDRGRHRLAARHFWTPRGDERMAPSDQFAKSAWMLASIAVVVAALYLAKGVLVPLTLAVLLSFLLSPVCDWLERRRLGRIPAVLVTAILGFAVLGIAAWTAVVQMTDLAPKMPEYQDNIQAKLHSVNDYFIAALSKVTRTAEDIGQNLPQAEQAETPQGTDERPYSVRVLSSPASPLQVLGGTFGTLIEGLGIGRHRHRSRGLLPGPPRGLARSLHPAGGKRSSDRDHADAGRRRQAGQPIPLDAVSRQCSLLALRSASGFT